MRTEVEGFFGPGGRGLWKTEDGCGVGGGEGAEARKCIGDSSMTVLHVHNGEVVASQAGDLGKGRRKCEKEDAI